MQPSREEAEVLLAEAQRAGQSVFKRTPKEYGAFYGWGAFQALVIPGFDVFDRTVRGWVTMAVAVVGFFLTAGYYATRARHVRVTDRSPRWTWPVLTVWICLMGLVSWLLDGALSFSYLLGGWLGAVPLFVWGQRLRRAG